MNNDGDELNSKHSDSQAANCISSRDKLWIERDAESKIEALRQQVIHLSHATHDALERINNLERHEHSVDGSLMVPLLDNRNFPTGYHRNLIPTALRDKE